MFSVVIPPDMLVDAGEIVTDPVDKTVTYKAYPSGSGAVNLIIHTNPSGASEDSLAARFRIHLKHHSNA